MILFSDNAAIGRPVTLSSVSVCPGSDAVDGKVSTVGCTTTADANPWMAVELADPSYVIGVAVVNDVYGKKLTLFIVSSLLHSIPFYSYVLIGVNNRYAISWSIC